MTSHWRELKEEHVRLHRLKNSFFFRKLYIPYGVVFVFRWSPVCRAVPSGIQSASRRQLHRNEQTRESCTSYGSLQRPRAGSAKVRHRPQNYSTTLSTATSFTSAVLLPSSSFYSSTLTTTTTTTTSSSSCSCSSSSSSSSSSSTVHLFLLHLQLHLHLLQ